MDAEDFSTDSVFSLTEGDQPVPLGDWGECHGPDLEDFLRLHPDFAGHGLVPHAVASVHHVDAFHADLHVVAQGSGQGRVKRVVRVARDHLVASSVLSV